MRKLRLQSIFRHDLNDAREIGHCGNAHRIGTEGKIRSYIIGDPLVAQTMITHDPGVGLNVPVRVVIFQTASGEVRLAYDLPSSLMSRLHNEAVSSAALRLDAKLRALAELAIGALA